MDPKNPRILFAGMWQLEIHTWGRDSGGPGSGLFMSRDGGATWTRLQGRGLPTKPVGKVAVAISASNPQRVYALIETGDGVPWKGQETERGQLWRSDDGGDTWQVVSYDHNAMGRAHYYSRMAVAPDDPDEAYFLTASFAKSIDGGKHAHRAAAARRPRLAMAPGGDHHDIWIDPTNANRLIVAHDQGLSITINRGKTWYRQRLKNAQIYHVTVDNEIPYNVLGNKQDEPTYRGPSNSRLQGGFGGDPGIPRAMWHAVGGGESGWATPDPTDSNIVWSTASGSGMVGGIVVRLRGEPAPVPQHRGVARSVERPGRGRALPLRLGRAAADLAARHNTIYVGSQHVHRTTNGGQSWEVISPDLTLNDRSRMGSSGGLTPDNIGVEYAGVVYGIAESPRVKGLIWAGTNDGLVQLTRDGGKTWTNVTKNLPGLSAWGSVRSIAPSRYDDGTAYLTVDCHQVNNRDPWVYRTTDYGATWRLITNGIPKSMLSYAKVIYEDPVRRGLLYLGTENAIYVSFDDGDTWQPLQNDLPHAPVSGIVVQEHFNDLVISTYGRGFWILDDITPLREMTPQVLAADAHLFDAAGRLPLPRHHGAVDAVRRSDRRREPAVRRGDQLLPEEARAGRRHGDDLERARTRSCARSTAGRRRPQPRRTGTCATSRRRSCEFRTDPMYGHELPLAERRQRPPAAGGGADHASWRRRALHREALDRRPRLHAAAHRAQGPALGRHRGRHRGADHPADDAARRTEHRRRRGEPARVRARPDPGASQRTTSRQRGEADGRKGARRADRARDEPLRPADHRRPGRRPLRRQAAVALQLPGQRRRRAATSSRPISTSRWRSCSASGCRRSSAQLERLVDKDVAAFNELLRRHSAGHIVTKAP